MADEIAESRVRRGARSDADPGHEGDDGAHRVRGNEKGANGRQKGLLQRPALLVSGALVLLGLGVGGLLWWRQARNYESSDDAFIDTHIVRLAPQTSGRVSRVLVEDNALVRAGQPLIEIDSASAQTRVAQSTARRAQAQSQISDALAQVQVNEAAYRQALADAAAAGAQAANAARDLARFQNLERTNPAAVAQQQYDKARTVAAQTAAEWDAAVKAAMSRLAGIGASRTQVASARAQVKLASAQLNETGINLGYNRIVAPLAGHVAQETVAVGNYVQPGTQMLAIVPLNLWVTANFKETQLARMRVGQRARIRVDACPGDRIYGHVDSIQRGAGQAFGILPPENATGNYVKVVQRVPVKIILDNPPADCPLGPGLSVEPAVRVR